MSLRLNPAHPLCQPSRNLVFASFGTGLGGQVLDLADSPQHGTIDHGGASQGVVRTLGSVAPPGFPSDFQSLAMRSAAVSQVNFGNTTKVRNLTSGFTVALWWRPHDVASVVRLAGTSPGNAGFPVGWHLRHTANPSLEIYYADGVYAIPTTMIRAREWCHIALTFGVNAVTAVYVNGALVSPTANNTDSILAGSVFWIGGDSGVAALADFGPVCVWGSVLSADDVALLYRDTWGMVTRPRLRLIGGAGGGGGSGGGLGLSTLNVSRRRR